MPARALRLKNRAPTSVKTDDEDNTMMTAWIDLFASPPAKIAAPIDIKTVVSNANIK